MISKTEKTEPIKLNVWVTKSQKAFLTMLAEKEGTSVADVTRQAIELYKNSELFNSVANNVCETIDKQMNISFKKQMDRIVKLVVKSIISSESANHISAEVLSSIRKIDINEIKDTAYHYATNYLKKGGGIYE